MRRTYQEVKHPYSTSAILPGGILLALMASNAFAQTPSGQILYYESIDIDLVRAADGPYPSLSPATATARISASGRQYVAHLSQNRALVRNLPAETRAAIADITIWQGTLDNIRGSWISLVQRGAYTSGGFSDGITSYGIGPFDSLQDRLLSPNPQDAGKLIVYPQPGTVSLADDWIDATKTAAGSTLRKISRASPEPSEKPVLSQGLEVEIAVVIDAEFAAERDGFAEADAIAEINAADAIFVHQIGLHLTISELRLYESEPDPFSATASMTSILQEFRNFVYATPAFLQADLSHLFTGRSLPNVSGYAYIGGVCEPGGGISVTAARIGWGTVTAHEIAHTFGVPHDGEAGRTCADTPPGFLMDSVVSGSFSDCSIGVLKATIASVSCLSPVPDSDLVLSLTSAPIEVLGTSTFRVGLNLDSVGTYESLAIEIEVDSPSAAVAYALAAPDSTGNRVPIDCDTDAAPVLCRVRAIQANSSLPFELYMDATEMGDIVIDVDAWSLNDTDRANNHASVAVHIAPAVELSAANIAISPELAGPNQLVTISMDLVNSGVADATDVELDIARQWSYFEFVSADLPSGADCILSSDGGSLVCPVGAIPTGAMQPISIVLRALEPGLPHRLHSEPFSLRYSAAEPDTGTGSAIAILQVSNVSADVRLTMTGPATFEVGGEASFSVTIENLGPDTVDRVGAIIRSPELTLSGSEPCYTDWVTASVPMIGRIDGVITGCWVFQMKAGETANFVISGVPDSIGNFSAEAQLGGEFIDPNVANNSVGVEWAVTAPTPTPPVTGTGGTVGSGGSGAGGNESNGKSKGGGGVFGLDILLLAGILLARRAPRFRCPAISSFFTLQSCTMRVPGKDRRRLERHGDGNELYPSRVHQRRRTAHEWL